MKNFIFVDFDDTLCLHKKKIESANFIAFNALDICDTVYKDSIPNKALINYLYKKQNEDYLIIMLTSACSKMLDIKKVWCIKHCPELFDDYISVSIDISKSEIMDAFIKRYNLNPSDCIFIDDNCEERWLAERLNITTFNPQIIQDLEH